MSYLRGFSGLIVLMVFGAPASHAETHVVDVYDLAIEVSPVGILNVVDLNAELTGITDVSVRVVGVGGGGNFECFGAIPDGWYDLDVKLAFGNKWFSFPTTNQVAFDEVASEMPSDPDPYSVCEGVTQCVLPMTAYAHGTQDSDCRAMGVTLPVISHVELTITADSVLPTSEVSWGTLKAIYSGTR